MGKIVSLPVAVQLEFEQEGNYDCFDDVYPCKICMSCDNDCAIFSVSSNTEVFCIKYKKSKDK